jgi:hypothetical protein
MSAVPSHVCTEFILASCWSVAEISDNNLIVCYDIGLKAQRPLRSFPSLLFRPPQMSPAVVTLLASWRHSPRIYVTSKAHDQPEWLNGCMLHLRVWHAANQPTGSSCCSVFVLYIVLLFTASCSVSCRAPCGIACVIN